MKDHVTHKHDRQPVLTTLNSLDTFFHQTFQIMSRVFARALAKSAVARSTEAAPEEVAHFNALASTWWDVNGSQRILHKMNLLRMDYIREMVTKHVKVNEGVAEEDEVYVPPYSVNLLPKDIRRRISDDHNQRTMEILRNGKLKALDVGCGGGIFAESMARLEFINSVKGIDLLPEVVEAARIHKEQDPSLESKLEYEMSSLEDLDPAEKFDIVTIFEVLEHVPYPSKMIGEAFSRVAPGGWVFLLTINRDLVSWFTTIFIAENIAKIVPKKTHTLSKYIDEQEIREWLLRSLYAADYKVVDSRGCIYIPACGWVYSGCPGIGNYFMAIKKQG